MIYEDDEKKIQQLSNLIDVSHSVAAELLTLAGGDVSLAWSCSFNTCGLNQCKAAIINSRFNSIERKNDDKSSKGRNRKQ